MRKSVYIAILIFTIISFQLLDYSSIERTLTNNEQIKNIDSPTTKTTFGKGMYIQNSELNAIESVKVTCFLHLKTAQVLLDINYVGIEGLKSFTPKGIINESITVLGTVRNVLVIEEGSITLSHQLTVWENGTIIEYDLSSIIPIGLKRNIKISFVQDTTNLESNYNYQLGINWNRTLGSQNVFFICDTEISLLNVEPESHTITSITGQLTLAWLEVNSNDFYASINYTRRLTLHNLIITPIDWNIGNIRTSNKPIEKIFTVFNNESTQLTGVIITPYWIITNISNWELSVGETMYLKVVIDISEVRNIYANVSLQCYYTYLPVNIHLIGEIRENNLLGVILPSVLVPIITLTGFITVKLLQKKKKNEIEVVSGMEETMSVLVEERNISDRINQQKWKEILTEKEYAIFEMILQHKELTQTDLCRLTDLSKSTVSRAISRLEAKGIILRKRYGISNFIAINEEFFS
ncbi:MAG TPA: MarR family transcriptional regulator [Candidatus Bathyarchaeia archaeon]|nr:MarR family transcriptional regulator [Candidatus Bathyarchaeia archaeon]